MLLQRHLTFISLVLLVLGANRATGDEPREFHVAVMVPPKAALPSDAAMDFKFEFLQQPYFIYVPKAKPDTRYGLLIFVSSDAQFRQPPPAWLDLADKRQLMLICPDNAGDDVPLARRMGDCVFGAMSAKENWNIDPKRVYVAGVGGGAGVAGALAFHCPDLFAGSVQMSGKNPAKTSGNDNAPYGLTADISTKQIDAARKSWRFVLITGQNDPQRSHTLDMAKEAYEKGGYQSTVFDVLGTSGGMCLGRHLGYAIDFIDKLPPATQPTRPAWMEKDPSTWPQILLRNKVAFKGKGGGVSGSSSLMRLPNGVVVLGTAGHLLDAVQTANFSDEVKSWTAFATTVPARVNLMTRMAMDGTKHQQLDVLVLCPRSQTEPWCGQVLTARTEPLEAGETVYLVAVPLNSDSGQNVYKGVVIARRLGGYNVDFNIDVEINAMGVSGAPVLDAWGQLAGIYSSHLTVQTVPGKKQCVAEDVSEVLKIIELPDDVKPAPVGSTPLAVPPLPSPATPPATVPSPPAADGGSDIVAKKANDALRTAQLLIDNKVYDRARGKLQAIISAYPATDAAKKAQELLKQLPQ